MCNAHVLHSHVIHLKHHTCTTGVAQLGLTAYGHTRHAGLASYCTRLGGTPVAPTCLLSNSYS